MMHTDAVTTERESDKNFFEEKKNKEGYPVYVTRVMTALYWLCKEEVCNLESDQLRSCENCYRYLAINVSICWKR